MIGSTQELSQTGVGFLKFFLSFVQALRDLIKHLILMSNFIVEVLPFELDRLYNSMYLIQLIILVLNLLLLLLNKCLVILPSGHVVLPLGIPGLFLFFKVVLGGLKIHTLCQDNLGLSLSILQRLNGLFHTLQSLLSLFHAPKDISW